MPAKMMQCFLNSVGPVELKIASRAAMGACSSSSCYVLELLDYGTVRLGNC